MAVASVFVQGDLGEVTVAVNPAAIADPVVVQPVTEPAVYIAFAEAIGGSGLVHTVFLAHPQVASRNTPLETFVRWPEFYATTTPPWGRPFDPTSGWTEKQCEGVRWTSAVNTAALGRAGYLERLKDDAEAMVVAIDRSLAAVFFTGTVTVAEGDTESAWQTPAGWTVTAGTAIMLTVEGANFAPAHRMARDVALNRWRVEMAASAPAGGTTFAWLVVAKK